MCTDCMRACLVIQRMSMWGFRCSLLLLSASFTPASPNTTAYCTNNQGHLHYVEEKCIIHLSEFCWNVCAKLCIASKVIPGNAIKKNTSRFTFRLKTAPVSDWLQLDLQHCAFITQGLPHVQSYLLILMHNMHRSQYPSLFNIYPETVYDKISGPTCSKHTHTNTHKTKIRTFLVWPPACLVKIDVREEPSHRPLP